MKLWRHTDISVFSGWLKLLNSDYPKKLISTVYGSIGVIVFFRLFWPGIWSYDLFEFWTFSRGSFMGWLYCSLPAFAWAGGLTALVSYFTKNPWWVNKMAEELYQKGFWISLEAGIKEELVFRWLLFYSAMAVIWLVNFIWLGLLWLLQLYLFGPLANWLTHGYLSEQLVNPQLWYVGAAILSANALFRDGHKYLGIVGYINSWFMGMYFFWLMFHYGLFAAMATHFIYDFLIFSIRYADMVLERRQHVI